MFKFEQLNVYQEELKFIDLIYLFSQKWPREELFGITLQIRRAVVSIALNTAEGTSRSKKDFCHFIDMARGSCYETIAILTIVKRRKYISEIEFNDAYECCEKISRMLSALKNSLR